jgi:hypothetical protein
MTTFAPGYRFVIAPHFHLPADWSRRLLIGQGWEELDGCFFPCPSWRPPTAEELSILLRDPAEPITSEELATAICLFQLPEHLRSDWWKLLEHSSNVLGEGPLPGFDTFVSRIVEFLAFKDFPVPEGAHCTVVVSQPGQRSVYGGPEVNGRAGLRGNLAPGAPWPLEDEAQWPRLWGGINLGDEATSVVMAPWPLQLWHEALPRPSPYLPATTTGELVTRLLRRGFSGFTVRLHLGPGEGYRLPRGGIILDGSTEDKQEPDMLLLISQNGRGPAPVRRAAL